MLGPILVRQKESEKQDAGEKRDLLGCLSATVGSGGGARVRLPRVGQGGSIIAVWLRALAGRLLTEK